MAEGPAQPPREALIFNDGVPLDAENPPLHAVFDQEYLAMTAHLIQDASVLGVPGVAVEFDDGTGTALRVSAANPLPVAMTGGGAATRVETLWTDDTNAYFVRVDSGTSISWTDVSGNASPAPGTGARPAAGASVLLTKTSFVATASGTGFSTGDYLDHMVTTDPSSGAVIGHFWINLTTEAKLASSPASASVSPLSPLPIGASTYAAQLLGNTSLTAIATALSTQLPASLGAKTGANSLSVVLATDAALPLPTGAATAANQPAVATAGSAAPTTGTVLMGSDGTNARRILTDGNGQVYVLPGGGLGYLPAAGNIAAGSTDGGNPLKIGGYAGSTAPTPVTTGQRVNAWYDLFGAAKVALTTGDGVGVSYSTGGSSDNDANSLIGTDRLLATRSYLRVWNGASYDRQRGDTSGVFIGANTFWTESTTALASSATLNGTLRTNGGSAGGVGSRFGFFVAEAFSDVAGGTLYIDKTVDGGTSYRQAGSIALVAGTSVTLKLPVSAAGYRARVVNGTTAQAAALVTSAYTLA